MESPFGPTDVPHMEEKGRYAISGGVRLRLAHQIRKAICMAVGLFVVGAMFPLAAHAAAPRRISITDASVIEGDAGTQAVSFLVSYSGKGKSGITVAYATSNGSATAGADYVSVAGVASLPNGGCKCTTVTVDALGDLAEESTETFKVNLSAPTGGASIRDGLGIGTIYDNDGPPAIAVLSTVGGEADTEMNFTVSLTSPAPAPVSVDYATSDVTATAGSDYVATSGTTTFLPGDTARTVSVGILDDSLIEEDETFIVALSNAVGATIAGAQGTGTISDDDDTTVAEPFVSVDDVTVIEGDVGSSAATLTLSLSEASTAAVAVDFATSDAGAIAGADYVSTSGTATFAPGDIVETVDVQILGDTSDEPDEQFALNLSNGSGATITDGQGIGTITDDDSPAGLVATSLSLTVAKSTRRVTARGVLEPSVAGLAVRVTLLVRRDGRYRKVAAKETIVTALDDRDHDSVADAAFSTRFRRPAHGRYKLRAVFTGSIQLARCAKVIHFRL